MIQTNVAIATHSLIVLTVGRVLPLFARYPMIVRLPLWRLFRYVRLVQQNIVILLTGVSMPNLLLVLIVGLGALAGRK